MVTTVELGQGVSFLVGGLMAHKGPLLRSVPLQFAQLPSPSSGVVGTYLVDPRRAGKQVAHRRELTMNTLVLALLLAGTATQPTAVNAQQGTVPEPSPVIATAGPSASPCEPFTNPPQKPHDPADYSFSLEQLEHWYRVPGEFTYRLKGDQYGFESLSFIITDSMPGGGPGLHVHDSEEAHILLDGTAQYRMADDTFTVHAPYVVKVPAGVRHTFINAGSQPFKLVAVLASKHPKTTRIGPNPLVTGWQTQNGIPPCRP